MDREMQALQDAYAKYDRLRDLYTSMSYSSTATQEARDRIWNELKTTGIEIELLLEQLALANA